ncbi:hypothetical protein [uncultured Tateyamaria sp.]|uniref:hypothetical protein n=1 Tax=uncultured Tateyamaria sp. TaxID=455651 RepID=UPI002605F799|nr:hypothetical protein [uncultured Tateyamaria sp.]
MSVSHIAAFCLAVFVSIAACQASLAADPFDAEASTPSGVMHAQNRTAATKDPFKALPQPAQPSLPSNNEDDVENPFGDTTLGDATDKLSEGGCGPETSLGRAELRKPQLATDLCKKEFGKLDKEWLFILYYISGFNEFLEDRGAFMDPTGACSRAVEPRQSLNLTYEVIDFVLSGGQGLGTNPKFERMLEPFFENKWRAPLVFVELNVWKREGRLDATSVASRGMCGDPKFKQFWESAIEYAKRVPGTE